jgi:hypothetical protein
MEGGSVKRPIGVQSPIHVDRTDNITNLIKYLGMFLSAPAEVAKMRQEKVTSEIIARYNRWIARRISQLPQWTQHGHPLPRQLRCVVFSAGAIPPNLTAMPTPWRAMAWKFFQAPENATKISDPPFSGLEVNSNPRPRRRATISRHQTRRAQPILTSNRTPRCTIQSPTYRPR